MVKNYNIKYKAQMKNICFDITLVHIILFGLLYPQVPTYLHIV